MSLFTTAQIPILHDSPGPWIMHVPVVSTRHIPPGEAEALLRLRPLECRSPDDPPLLAHLLDGVGHLFLIEDLDADEMTTFPLLRVSTPMAKPFRTYRSSSGDPKPHTKRPCKTSNE